jgi:diaminohydroxyphosphoribosylaminopyrimidine deaminase / 5-amino-6-(5-phosphoribosylamino)uracil reductase
MIPFVFFPESLKAKLFLQDLLVDEPEAGETMTDLQAMKLAIQEAYKGIGHTSPNPMVGCVILNSKNEFMSSGYHARVGEAHAEINALKNLKADDLKGAKVFVTLEPCSHEGRTGSCAKALAQLPVSEVIYGLKDPNPLVSGQGLEILRAAKIKVTEFDGLNEELEEVCEHFLWNQRQKKVYVSLKVASSLDGQLALKTGESQWITDEVSREITHLLRAGHDAILVGAGTIRTDNPKLNVRHPTVQPGAKKLIILDPDGSLLEKAAELQLAEVHEPENVFFAVSEKLAAPKNPWGAKLILLPSEGLNLDLSKLLNNLWDLGIKSVFVEGGAQVLSSFISSSIAQRLYVFQAPVILGGKSGKGWAEQVNISSMKDKRILKHQQYLPLKNDVLISGKF